MRPKDLPPNQAEPMLQFIRSSYFKSLLESLASGVLIFNTAGRVYAANQAAEKMFGFSQEALMDPATLELLLAGTPQGPQIRQIVQEATTGQVPASVMQVNYRTPDGSERYLTANFSLLESYGKIFGIFLNFVDITEVVLLHEKEKHLLKSRNQAQQTNIENLHKFSEAVAHQIRNPTMSIGGFANYLLKKREPDDPEIGHMERILSASQRLLDIVEAVNQYRALPNARPRRLQLHLELEQIVEDLRGLAAGQCPQARLSLEALPLEVLSDPELIGLILRELVVNALEHLPAEGGRIEVILSQEPGQALLMVRDNGRGIPPESMPYLYDPFFTDKAVGVGLGLTRVQRMAQELGAAITVENRSQDGVLATLSLPQY